MAMSRESYCNLHIWMDDIIAVLQADFKNLP